MQANSETFATISALRAQLWDSGFRPLEVHSWNQPTSKVEKERGKIPLGDDWNGRALRDPPEAVTTPVKSIALNTGLLCHGLRAIDIDINDPDIAGRVKSLAIEQLGETALRTRDNSPRCLLLYRADTGTPRKRNIKGEAGQIEVMGAGQQIVAFGTHYTGATLRWAEVPGPPGEVCADNLPAITEEALTTFLADCAEIIGAKPESDTNTGEHRPSDHGLEAESTLEVMAAVAAIPNPGPTPNWDFWNRVGMAIWAATSGSEAGWLVFRAWSETHPVYDAVKTQKVWTGYDRSPPHSVGMGTLKHLAREAAASRPFGGQRTEGAPTSEAEPEEAEEGEAEAKGEPRGHFDILLPTQISEQQARPYIIKGLIAHGDHVIVMGPPESGKSVIVPHLCYAVAQGRQVYGRRVKAGPVLYIAAEDGHGMKNRVRALLKRHGDAPFHLIHKPVNLMEDGADLAALYAAVDRIRPVLVVIDTIAKSFPGLRENDSDSMSRVTQVVRALTAICDSAVCSVHHVAKDGGRSPRGHGSLEADADLTALTAGKGKETRSLDLGKNRNGPSDITLTFEIEVAGMGTDEDGDPITAPIATEGGADPATDKPRREDGLTDKTALLLRYLRNIDSTLLQPVRPTWETFLVKAVRRDTFRAALIADGWFADPLLFVDTTGRKANRAGLTAESNSLMSLKRRNIIGYNREWVWLA